MKFLLTSDTHYGVSKNTHRIHEKFLRKCKAEIEREKIAAFIHAGDWTSYKQDQFKRTLKMFRLALGAEIPIVSVRGNHEFWDPGYRQSVREYVGIESAASRPMFGQLDQKHKLWFDEANIIHLESKPLIIDDVIILGFDGWYYLSHPPTNDHKWIRNNIEGVWFHTWLANRAYKQLETVLSTDTSQYRKAICVTHFPSFSGDAEGIDFCANPKYVEFLSEKFDVVCTGHSHRYCDTVINGCRFINSGSDYDMPAAKLFEV